MHKLQVFNSMTFLSFFKNPYLKIRVLILEREGGRERGKERNIDVRERRDRLPPVCALIGDRTHSLGTCPDRDQYLSLLVCGMTLQPAEPPGHGRLSTE